MRLIQDASQPTVTHKPFRIMGDAPLVAKDMDVVVELLQSDM